VDPSLFVISATLQADHHAAEADAVITRELARLAKDTVRPKEMERAKNGLDFSFYQGLDSNSEQASFLGREETVAGDFRHGLERRRQVQAVTPAQVREATARYLVPKNRTVLIGVPK
jgi:zinc protease